MKLFYSDTFVLPLPAGHRFPMAKYARLRQRVLDAGLVPPCELRVPEPASDAELGMAHAAGYVARVAAGALSPAEMRRIGFPWSPALVARSRRSVGGTIVAGHAALLDGVAVNLAGGTHHAFAAAGEGYCVFNDVAVATNVLRRAGAVRRVAVIDCDVHQGNGTAALFAADADVFTFSVHGAKNFPFRKECSSLDIALPDDAGDDAFLDAVRRGTRAALAHDPDLVFYVAGADAYAGDRLGRLAVTKLALAERDAIVFAAAGLAGVPVVVVMGGGYALDVEDTVDIHLHTVCSAAVRFGAVPVSTMR